VFRLHDSPCVPLASTSVPQGHVLGTRRFMRRRKPSEIRMASLSRRRVLLLLLLLVVVVVVVVVVAAVVAVAVAVAVVLAAYGFSKGL